MHWEKNSKAIMASLLLAKHTEAPHPLQHHSHIPQPFKASCGKENLCSGMRI